MENEMNIAPTTGLDQVAVQELVQYIMGTQAEPPKALDKMMTNLYQKLQLGLGYAVAANVQRQAKLTKFIAQVEEELYNVDSETLANMDKDQMAELYKNASKALSEMNEFERRFLAQNKDVFGTHKTEQEKLAQQLMTLPADKLEAIMNIIKGETALNESQGIEEELGDL